MFTAVFAADFPGTPLWVALLLWSVPLAVLVWRTSSAQLDYLRLVRTVLNPNLALLPGEYWRRYLRQPWLWPLESIGQVRYLTGLYWRPQSSPVLEEARHRFMGRYWILVAYLFGGYTLLVLWSLMILR